MSLLRRLRARWTARRMGLAVQQLQAYDMGSEHEVLSSDWLTTEHVMSSRALSKLLGAKATSHTEWRGD